MERKLQAASVAFLLLFAAGSATHAFGQQGIITTIAGGGSNGASARLADIGNTSTVAVDGSGNIYFGSIDLHQVFKLDFRGGFTVVAGTGSAGFSGDDGPATEAALGMPMGIAVDRQGNLFISNTFNGRVRRVDALAGTITTVAGNGRSRFSGDGGLATDAGLGAPGGLALDAQGNLFIAANWDVRIRRVDAATGVITTVAGNGQSGFSGDGGPATSASFGPPNGVAVDARGDVFLDDFLNGRIRRVDAVTGIITTVAGNGVLGYNGDGGPATSASLRAPKSVALDDKGNLFIAEYAVGCIRRMDRATGTITTVLKDLYFPQDVAVDALGNVYIAQGSGPGSTNRILRVDAVTGTATTVAGDGSYGLGGDGGSAISASLASPQGIAVDARGRLLIADTGNNRVRAVELPPFAALSPAAFSFASQLVGNMSAARTVTVTNTGLVPLIISSISIGGTNAGDFAQTNSCGSPLKPGENCVVNVTFTPTDAGMRTATLAIDDSGFGSPHSAMLSGMGATGTTGVAVGSSSR